MNRAPFHALQALFGTPAPRHEAPPRYEPRFGNRQASRQHFRRAFAAPSFGYARALSQACCA